MGCCASKGAAAADAPAKAPSSCADALTPILAETPPNVLAAVGLKPLEGTELELRLKAALEKPLVCPERGVLGRAGAVLAADAATTAATVNSNRSLRASMRMKRQSQRAQALADAAATTQPAAAANAAAASAAPDTADGEAATTAAADGAAAPLPQPAAPPVPPTEAAAQQQQDSELEAGPEPELEPPLLAGWTDRARVVFSIVDSDGDGVVVAEELRELVRLLLDAAPQLPDAAPHLAAAALSIAGLTPEEVAAAAEEQKALMQVAIDAEAEALLEYAGETVDGMGRRRLALSFEGFARWLAAWQAEDFGAPQLGEGEDGATATATEDGAGKSRESSPAKSEMSSASEAATALDGEGGEAEAGSSPAKSEGSADLSGSQHEGGYGEAEADAEAGGAQAAALAKGGDGGSEEEDAGGSEGDAVPQRGAAAAAGRASPPSGRQLDFSATADPSGHAHAGSAAGSELLDAELEAEAAGLSGAIDAIRTAGAGAPAGGREATPPPQESGGAPALLVAGPGLETGSDGATAAHEHVKAGAADAVDSEPAALPVGA